MLEVPSLRGLVGRTIPLLPVAPAAGTTLAVMATMAEGLATARTVGRLAVASLEVLRLAIRVEDRPEARAGRLVATMAAKSLGPTSIGVRCSELRHFPLALY